MLVSIMQPTFLPWVGYFYMISKSDLFIFLDDVQFERRSFQSRNKILVGNTSKIITVPVNSKNKFNQLIKETEVNYDQDWTKKHLKTIYLNYCKHKFFSEIFKILEEIFIQKEKQLVNLNTNLIKSICNYLEIKTNFNFSSNFKIKKNKEEKILELIKLSGGTEYLTSPKTKNYLGQNGEFLSKNNIKVYFLDYECKIYDQKNSDEFIGYLSIIDLLFNHGKKAKSFF